MDVGLGADGEGVSAGCDGKGVDGGCRLEGCRWFGGLSGFGGHV